MEQQPSHIGVSLASQTIDAIAERVTTCNKGGALSGQSCSDLLMDEFLKGSWLAGGK